MNKQTNLIILGSGPAGYTTAIYAARANLSPVLITGHEQGGQLTRTDMIDNWPGDVSGVAGVELMDRMLRHAERFGTRIINDQIVGAELTSGQPFKLIGESGKYECRALIIATGAAARYLGLPSEQAFLGRGVSGCAVCDGFFYKGKDVAVVGGGDTAVSDALYLSNIASSITLVHRRDQLRAQPFLIDRLMELNKSGKVHIEWDSAIAEVLGDAKGVTGINVKNLKSNATKNLSIHGLFVAIGHKPNSEVFAGQIEMIDGFIKTNWTRDGNFTATNIQGVFAAGDVADRFYRQAITAAASGCMAALDVEKYLS